MSKNTKAPSDETTTFSPASMALGIMIVGASAGLVLYTKRTRQLLTQIDRAQASQNTRKGINPVRSTFISIFRHRNWYR